MSLQYFGEFIAAMLSATNLRYVSIKFLEQNFEINLNIIHIGIPIGIGIFLQNPYRILTPFQTLSPIIPTYSYTEYPTTILGTVCMWSYVSRRFEICSRFHLFLCGLFNDQFIL